MTNTQNAATVPARAFFQIEDNDIQPAATTPAAVLDAHARAWDYDDPDTYGCADCGQRLPRGFVHFGGHDDFLAIWPSY